LSTGDSSKASYVFDAAVLSHPGLYKLRYVDQISNNPAYADVVKGRIKRVVLDKLEDLWIKKGGQVGGGGGGRSSSEQRTLRGYRATDVAAAYLSDEENDDAAGARGAASLTMEAWAKQQLHEYLQWCAGKGGEIEAAKRMTFRDVPAWWWKTGSSMFPNVALVFQSLLAMPGGAASLERDFSIASNVLTVRRAQLDPGYVEMSMLLRMNLDKIPPLSQIPILSLEEGVDAVPRRLRNKEDLEKFRDLDVSERTARRAMREGIGGGVRERGRDEGGRDDDSSDSGDGEGGAEGGRKEGERDDDDGSDSDEDSVEENEQQATERTRYYRADGIGDGDDDDGGNDIEVLEV